jgi:ABC-type multidrug transport system ATPase subunit/ABC-type multidrug transport system permease subunit
METVGLGSPDGAITSNTSSKMESVGLGSPDGAMQEYTMRWSRMRKTVEIKPIETGLIRSSISSAKFDANTGKRGAIEKVILNNVSGAAFPSEVLALMGPSGSGKTSLLNALSGRSSYDSGVITINDKPMTGASMKRLMSKIAYVKQNDVFFGHLTVRDQLTYTALLRLPSSLPKASKHEEVDRIIKLLRLSKVADSPIMLLSGGEKKRVNIGTELLTDPAIIMLDEPTSGLDSTSAVSLMNLLHTLAKNHGKTVVTSIHQPSSAVFRSFDRLLMLAEGSVVYFGSPVESLSYLRDLNLACPDGYNASDHWMDLLVIDSAIEEEEEEEEDQDDDNAMAITERTNTAENSSDDSNNEGLHQRRQISVGRGSPRVQLICAWDSEAVAEQNDMAEKEGSDSGKDVGNLNKIKKYNTTWLTQFGVLTHRSLKNSRAAIFTPLNFVKSIALGLIAGLLWFQLGSSEKYVSDKSSYYFFTMTYWVFDSMFGALMSFPAERVVILKERASASYHLSAYFLGKTVSETPTRLTLPFIYMLISFWMGAISPEFTVFLGSVACTLMSVLAGESFGLMIGTSIYDMERAMTVMTVCALGLMLLGGFYVQNVPSFVAWAQYLSPFKYSYDASLHIVFNDQDVSCDGSGALGALCGGASTGSVPGNQVVEFLGVTTSVGFNVGLLTVLIIVPRFIAYRFLLSKKGGERS